MKIGVILNGQKKVPALLKSRIDLAGSVLYGAELYLTQSAQDAASSALKWCLEKEIIIAAGGDGTLHHVVNGMMAFRQANPEKALPMLAVLPLGTGNDYARQFGWQRGDVIALESRITHIQTLSVDIGEMRFSDRPSKFFCNIADAGLGAHVASIAERLKMKLPSFLVFPLAILRGLLSYRSGEISIRTDEYTDEGYSLTTVIAIGHTFGDGLHIAPGANVHDGMFRVVRIGRVSVWEYLWHLPSLKKGKPIDHPEIFYFTTREVGLSGLSTVEADGEVMGAIPVEMSMHHRALTILK